MAISNLPGVTINGNAQISGNPNYTNPSTVCLLAGVDSDPTNGTDTNFWKPLAWYSNYAVDSYYGSQFNSNGSLNSALSLGAFYAFQGGANTVIIQPFYTGSDENTGITLETALSQIQEKEGINLIVPIGLTSNQLSTVASSMAQSNSSGYKRRGIFAVDNNSGTDMSVSDFSSLAQSLNTYEIMLLGNTQATSLNGITLPPSMYACELAGMSEFYGFNTTLTNKTVVGFANDNTYSNSQLSTLIGAGVACVSFHGGANVLIEAITTLQGKQLDFSFAGVDNFISDSLMTYYSGYIGKSATTTVLLGIKGATQSFLATQKRNNLISSFSDISVIQDPAIPTQVDVSFTCTWLSPIYNVTVNYTFNSSSTTSTTQSNIQE